VSATAKPPTPALALTIDQAADSLGVSWDTWHEHIEHEVKIVRIGRRKLVPVRELERWLDEHAERVLEGR
jgi:excisionase family DNA binding protein